MLRLPSLVMHAFVMYPYLLLYDLHDSQIRLHSARSKGDGSAGVVDECKGHRRYNNSNQRVAAQLRCNDRRGRYRRDRSASGGLNGEFHVGCRFRAIRVHPPVDVVGTRDSDREYAGSSRVCDIGADAVQADVKQDVCAVEYCAAGTALELYLHAGKRAACAGRAGRTGGTVPEYTTYCTSATA